MTICKICQNGEIVVSTKDGVKHFRCKDCKSVLESSDSSSDTEVYNRAFKKYQHDEYLEQIVYAGDGESKIRAITLALNSAKELGLEDVKELEDMLEQERTRAQERKKEHERYAKFVKAQHEEHEEEREHEEKNLIDELVELNAGEQFELHHKELITYPRVEYTAVGNLKLDYRLEETIKNNPFYEGLYSYQKESFEKIMNGENVTITAPTSTGKTLAFTMPMIQKIIEEGTTKKSIFTGRMEKQVFAIVPTPTKALTSDQLGQIKRYAEPCGIKVGMLTGDVGENGKMELLNNPPQILLTNFDMIYTHLLRDARFAPWFTDFKMLVIDEVHYYEGIHGSNIHHLLAALKRYSPKLQMVAASATIDNLDEFSKKLFNTEKVKVIQSNQKNGVTQLAVISPSGIGFSALLMNLCRFLVSKKKQFLIFWDSKTGVEKFAWRAQKEGLNIEVHRAGLTPNERTEIESKLKSRELDGLVCTPTLELGIDIGSIDVVISHLVPWHKFKQRIGRAGRRDNIGYGIMILGDDPVSAWFKKHPLDLKTEHNVHINPKNSRVSKFMIPFRVKCTAEHQNQTGADIGNNLIAKGEKLYLENESVFKENENLFSEWTNTEFQQFIKPNKQKIVKHLDKYSIRGMGGEVKVYLKPISGSSGTYNTKEKIGFESVPLAYQRFHKDAIYQHRRKCYTVTESHMHPQDDEGERYVIVKPVDFPTYYTKPDVDKSLNMPDDPAERKKFVGGIEILHRNLDIDKTVKGYTKCNLYNDDVIAKIAIEGEKFTFSTKGVVLKFPIEKIDEYQADVNAPFLKVKDDVLDGLHAIEHVLQHAGVTIAGISPENLDGLYENDSSITRFKKIYIVDDSGDGESGATQAIYAKIEETIRRAFEIISQCKGPKGDGCENVNGCPKCTMKMQKCTQYNDHLNKPVAIKKLEKVVTAIFEERLKEYRDTKWGSKEERLIDEKDMREKYGKLLNMEDKIDKISREFDDLEK